MIKIDLHISTSRYSPSSRLSPEELAGMVPFTGLDGLVISELNTQWPADEINELSAKVPDVKLYSAREISCSEGHFLLIGQNRDTRIKAFLTLEELVSLIDDDAALIWSRPCARGELPANLTASCWERVDAIEVMSASIPQKRAPLISRALGQHKKPPVCGSDSSVAMTLGTYGTLFPRLPKDEKELAQMIKAPLGVPWSNKKALIPINCKFKEDGDKLMMAPPMPAQL